MPVAWQNNLTDIFE